MITVTKTENLHDLRDAWQRLYQNNATLSYYQSFEYVETLMRHIAPYRLILRGKPVFFQFENDGTIVLILPLFKLKRGTYVLLGQKAGLGYLDAVYADGMDARTFDLCFSALADRFGVRHIHFEHVREETTLAAWLLQNGGSYSETACTAIPLPAEYALYVNSLGKHIKQNIRTAYNRLATDEGSYTFEHKSYRELSPACARELQSLYLKRQRARYGKGLLYRLFVKYVDVGTKIQTAPTVRVQAFILRINGRVAAYFDAICHEGGVIVPRLAINDGFARYSPGVMLLNESIRALIDAGVGQIDLTHGSEPYKIAMGGIQHRCVEADINR